MAKTAGYAILTGKVVTEDGSVPPERATIQSDCNGQLHTEAYSDRNGEFSFTQNSLGPSGGSEAGSMASQSWGRPKMQDWQNCDLMASVPGYVSERLHVANFGSPGSSSVGSIVVHAIGPRDESASVSLTSLSAPPKAKKCFDKGRDDERKGKWTAADEQFHKAIDVYPKYADAWFELARVQAKQGDVASARESLHQALRADPKLLRPYGALAELAFTEHQWRDLADTTDQLLQLRPESYPQFWYFNSVANFYMHQFDQAEKSDLRGISLDKQHHFPKMEYLMGMIMAVKHDYHAAAEHIRTYLRLAPNSSDAVVAQEQLADLERLAGSN